MRLFIEFISHVLSEFNAGGCLSLPHPAGPLVTRDSFTLPLGSATGPFFPPTEVLRETRSLTCLKGNTVRSSPPSGKISIYLIMQSSLAAPSLSLLPPFQNTFLALPLYNQRPIKVLFPKTKEQFLLKDDFSPHFEGGFSAFCYQGFQKHGVEFFLMEYFLQGSSAL